MVAAGVDYHKAVPMCGKVKNDLVNHRLLRVPKVYSGKSADRACHLIHQSAGLAEVNVFGSLRYFRDLDRIDASAVIKSRQYVADQYLKCR